MQCRKKVAKSIKKGGKAQQSRNEKTEIEPIQMGNETQQPAAGHRLTLSTVQKRSRTKRSREDLSYWSTCAAKGGDLARRRRTEAGESKNKGIKNKLMGRIAAKPTA